MKENNNNSQAGGIFFSLLAVAFICLKLTGLIDWSWLWVLAPIWIPAALGITILVIILITAVTGIIVNEIKNKRK